jgi:quercetin dioxygenase-like cupin family protein
MLHLLFVGVATAMSATGIAHVHAAETVRAHAAPGVQLGSRAFIWDELPARALPIGERREIVQAPTATLRQFSAHATTLNPGQQSHAPHQHRLEEMILIKEGTLEVTINGRTEQATAGSVLFYAANDVHSLRNVGATPATYLVLNFGTAATDRAPAASAAKSVTDGKLQSSVYEWTRLAAKPTSTGDRREFFNSPTVTCVNLSCHATTVRAHQASHASHRHVDEEIVIVKEGVVEVLLHDRTARGGPGSLFFFASNEEHGMRNAGDTPATYYVIRVVTEATPKAAPKSSAKKS